MTLEDVKQLINGDPDTLIKECEKLGINFEDLDKGLSKKLVKGMYPLTDDEFEVVDFVFWIAYLVEKTTEELIIQPEVVSGARQAAMETIIGKLHFADKITIIEELYTGKKNRLVKLMRKIQNLRNDIAHGRVNKLQYGGYNLSDNRGKIKLVADLRDAMLDK